MGDLAHDTTVTAVDARDGVYEGMLSRDWEIWGPQGGYLASFALRAAGAHCGRARPASLVGHFLGVASFDAPITITCTTLRAARVAQSVRASITQGGAPIFEAFVWGVDDGLAGLEHQDAPAPDVAKWSELPTLAERLAAIGEEAVRPFPFWDNFDQRPPFFHPNWIERATGEYPPVWDQWLRFSPTPAFADAWVDACRLLVVVDVGSWPAASGYHNQQAVIAPSIDLACEFHRDARAAEWLLMHAHAPSATEGLIGTHQQVFDERGALLASGVSQLLCRPVRP